MKKRHDCINPLELSHTKYTANESIYMDLIDKEDMIPRPYEPKTSHIELPFKKYDNAQSLLEAYGGTKNSAKQALILGRMSTKLTKNADEMLVVIEKVPEAIRHVDPSIMTKDFVERTLHQRPEIYELLSDEMKKQKEVIDAYAHGIQTNGCVFESILNGAWRSDEPGDYPTKQLPMYKYAISKSCDVEQFYSAENYKKAYERVILHGHDRFANPIERETITVYNSATAYLYMAHIENRDNPKMLAEYKWAEAHATVNCIDHIAEAIKSSYAIGLCSQEVKLMAFAIETLENPPEILGVEPQKELAEKIMSIAQEAERQHYIGRGEEARRLLEAMGKNGFDLREISGYRVQRIDELMELAENHPEMGFDENAITAWWKYRGESLDMCRNLSPEEQTNDMRYGISRVEEISKRHPELRIGEQLKIDGYDDPSLER